MIRHRQPPLCDAKPVHHQAKDGRTCMKTAVMYDKRTKKWYCHIHAPQDESVPTIIEGEASA